MDALVVGGGSIKGGYEAGALRALFRSGFTPRIATGTSVGAINVAALAAKEHLGFPAAGDWLATFWATRVTGPDVLLRKRHPLELLYRGLRKRWRGFVDTAPLEALIRDTLTADLERRRQMTGTGPRTLYRVSAVNTRTGHVEYHGADEAHFLDAVLASAAEPVAMAPRWIGPSRDAYTDGGVLDIAPLAQAIHLGATRIVAIVCQPEGIRGWVGNYHDVSALAGRLFGIIADEILNTDLRLCAAMNREAALHRRLGPHHQAPGAPRHIELLICRPRTPLPIDLLDFDARTMRQMVAQGEVDMETALLREGWPT